MWLAPLHAQGYPSWGKRELHFFSLSQEIFMPLLCDPLFLLKLLWVVSVIHNQNSSKLPLVRVVGMWKNKMWFVVSFSSLMWTELGIFPKMGKWDILSQCQDCERLVNLPNCLKKEDQKLTRSCRAAIICVEGKAKTAGRQVEKKWGTDAERSWDERPWSHWATNGADVLVADVL